MKALHLFMILAVCFLGLACRKAEVVETNDNVYTPPQQTTPTTTAHQQAPQILPRPVEYYKGEKIPEPIVAGTKARADHETKIEMSQDATRVVPEVNKDKEVKVINPETQAPVLINKDTGKATGEFYLRVEAKLFNDMDILHNVRQTIIDCAQNKNYRFEEEEGSGTLGRRGFAFKLWSELPGPISLNQTIEAALDDYRGRIRISRKDDRYIIITQER